MIIDLKNEIASEILSHISKIEVISFTDEIELESLPTDMIKWYKENLEKRILNEFGKAIKDKINMVQFRENNDFFKGIMIKSWFYMLNETSINVIVDNIIDKVMRWIDNNKNCI